MTQTVEAHMPPSLLIAGQWRSVGAGATVVHNPATGEALAELPLAGGAELEEALESAAAAFPAWSALAPDKRGEILAGAAALMRERAGNIARLITLEQGKPLAQSFAEVSTAAGTLHWYAQEGRRAYGRTYPGSHDGVRYSTRKEPVGVVVSLAPWNFPVTNAARKIGAALAAGCTCIHKPAEEAPSSALAVAQALLDAGLPPGVLSVVFGVPAEVSAHLLGSRITRKLSFTGSIPVGQRLIQMAAKLGIRTTMELGGHAPVIILEDADLEPALNLCVERKFANAGQICVSPTRFYVHESVFDRFVEGFRKRAEKTIVGNGLDPSTQMGPLAHRRRLAPIQDLVDDANSKGARVLSGGRRLPGAGYFFEPTVLADLGPEIRLMNEEPFGPIALINAFDKLDTAVREANRLPFGLAAYGFTKSLESAERLGSELQAGMVGINSFRISLPDTPFGGVKESGHGAENGIEGLGSCLITKLLAIA